MPQRDLDLKGQESHKVLIEIRTLIEEARCRQTHMLLPYLPTIHVEPAPAAGLESGCNHSKTVGGLYAPL